MTVDPYDRKNIQAALFFFAASTFITWWFIEVAPFYNGFSQKLLSCSIAGVKWALQIIFALIFLQGKKWNFIRLIGFTCFVGSLILLPFCISSFTNNSPGSEFFLGSLILSVAVMIVLYFVSVRKARVPMLWWAGWLLCLAIAITMQLKVVFNLSIF
jgi:hypothetical protein